MDPESTAKTPSRVVVIGGGIGGLSVAIGLRRYGIEADVYERRTAVEKIEAGAGMVLWHNAVRALQQIDVAPHLAPIADALEFAEWQSSRGPRLAHWDVKGMTETLGAPTYGIRRANLHKVLAAQLPESALHLSMNCTGFTQDANGATATFEDGTEVQADVLIGADGINSAIRGQLLGKEDPRYAGYTLWFGVVEPGATDPLPPSFHEIAGPGARFFSFPVGEGRSYWSAVRNAAAGGHDPASGPMGTLLETFKGWPDPVERLLKATDESTIARRDIVDRKPVTSWSQGRVVLMGDSAHPITFNLGQGAAQAIESAVVLSDRLGQAADIPTAIREFEDQRHKRTASFSNRAYQIGNMGRWTNPVACRFREGVMRIVFPTVAWSQHKKDMAHQL
jgi:2-polyprenyl-6-methoxyphenol hydroxylase-like FAD-dependent oxidoreductase